MPVTPTPVPPARLAETRLGPVEYSEIGTGAPVLVVHGTPGGYDQAVVLSRFLPPAEFSVIAVSRPGYLGTDLGASKSIDQQADLLAALLDELEVTSAGVLSWSGGGPAAYRLAVRHPERVTALVAFAAVSKELHAPPDTAANRILLTTRFGDWALRMLTRYSPQTLISGTIRSEGDLTRQQFKQRVAQIVADDAKRQFIIDVAPTARHDHRRRIGYDNDWKEFEAIADLELDKITARCLLVHGSVDIDVPPDHSQQAAERIPGAELLTVELGTHLCLLIDPGAEAAQARVCEFLR